MSWKELRGEIATGLVLALFLAGCGGGGSTTAPATDSLSRAEFLKRANTICRGVYAETGRRYSKLQYLNGGEATVAEINRAAQKIMVPALTKMEARLRALSPPAVDEQKIDRMLTALDEGIETAEEDVRTVRGYNGPFAFQKAYELMWAYGLEQCGLS